MQFSGERIMSLLLLVPEKNAFEIYEIPRFSVAFSVRGPTRTEGTMMDQISHTIIENLPKVYIA